MKTFKFSVDVFVRADTADEALLHMQEEFDYLCELDNNLVAVAYPDASEGSVEPGTDDDE